MISWECQTRRRGYAGVEYSIRKWFLQQRRPSTHDAEVLDLVEKPQANPRAFIQRHGGRHTYISDTLGMFSPMPKIKK